MRNLRTETTRAEAMRAKFRHGRADIAETAEEIAKKDKLHKQGRKKALIEEAVKAKARKGTASGDDEKSTGSAGEDALNAGAVVAEDISKNVRPHVRETAASIGKQTAENVEKAGNYIKKLHDRKKDKDVSPDKSNVQKMTMRKRIRERFTGERSGETAMEVTERLREAAGKAVDFVSTVLKNIVEKVASNPVVMTAVIPIVAVVLVIGGTFSSCSLVFGSMNHVAITTSFTADDDDILGANDDYTELEKAIQRKVNNIESTYPGMDEYRYELDQVGHNPFELAALLTVLYEDYTRAEVQEKLQLISDLQYTLETRETVERRTRTETRYHWVEHDGYESYESYTVEVEYDYHILTVILKNNSMDSVARSIRLSEDQIKRYEILLETYGNKKYLFEDDVYAAPNPGEYQDYDVPAELLTDVEFANMIHEAEKYLDMPYKWGGSSPSTGFDCSGFVSYVINHCGNGWNVGRQTANGLLKNCTPISESVARPGDLIFFKGTYATQGASHVGIYVGNGMMIHCGNPIQYASVNTNYWRRHFYTYGRLRH